MLEYEGALRIGGLCAEVSPGPPAPEEGSASVGVPPSSSFQMDEDTTPGPLPQVSGSKREPPPTGLPVEPVYRRRARVVTSLDDSDLSLSDMDE